MPQFVLYDQFGVKIDPVLIWFPWKPDQKFNPDFFGVKLDPEPIFKPNLILGSEFQDGCLWLPWCTKTRSVLVQKLWNSLYQQFRISEIDPN